MRWAQGVVGAVGVLLLSAVAFAGEQPAAAPHPNFSGRWALDLGRTRLQPGFPGGITSGVLRVTHAEPAFSLRRAFMRGGESEVVEFNLTTDGREVAGSEDGMPTRSSLTWSGESLLFVVVYKAPRGEARNTVRYTLADGCRTLRAEESFRGARLVYDNVWVFTRAE